MGIQLNGTSGTDVISAVDGSLTVEGLTISGDFNIADKIIHSGDTNTAIRFPAADTISFECAGEEILKIGKSSTELLRISGPIDASTQQEFGIGIAVNDVHTHPAAKITFKEFDASDSRGDLLFYTRGTNNDVASTERLRITSSGQVAIGTITGETNFLTTINGDLSLGEKSGTDNTYLDQKQDGDFHIINSGRTANGASATSAGGIGINRYNNIAGGTSLFRDFTVYNGKNSKVLCVDGSASSIGIGIDAPTRKLHIKDAGQIKLENTSTGGWIGLDFLASSGTNNYDGYMGIQDSDGLFFIDNNSNGHDIAITQSGQIRIPQNGAQLCWGASQQMKFYYENSEERMYLQGDGAYGFAFRVNGGNRIEINKTTGDVTMQGASGRNFNWDNSDATLYLTDNNSGSSARLKIGSSGDLQMYHDVGSHFNFITCSTNADLKISTKTLQVYEYTGSTKKFEVTNRGKYIGYHADTAEYGASNWARTGSGNQSNSSQATPEGSMQWQSNTSRGVEKYKSYIQTTTANQSGMYITIQNAAFYRITAKASHNSTQCDVAMWLVYGLNSAANAANRITQIVNSGSFSCVNHNTHVNSHDSTIKIDYSASVNQGLKVLVEQIGGF